MLTDAHSRPVTRPTQLSTEAIEKPELCQHNRVWMNTARHDLLTTENHGVGSSILPLATSLFFLHRARFCAA